MKQTTLSAFVTALTLVSSSAGASTITYDFTTDLSANISGSGVTASDLTVQLQAGHGGGYNGLAYETATGAGSGTGNNAYLFQTDQVAENGTTRSSTDGGFSLTLTPDAGQTLDFSSATLTLENGGVKDAGPNLNSGLTFFYQINSGTIEKLAGTLGGFDLEGNGGSANGDDVYSSADTLLFSDVHFETGKDALSTPLNISSIAGLSADDTVTFYLTFSSNRGDNTAKYAIAVDNIVFDGIAIPEPSSYALLLGLLALGSVMVRRRK